jgi:predicted nuclease with TOPRIM domain
MGLDFRYTCPEIDENKASFEEDIEVHLSNMLDECNPLLEGEQKKSFVKHYMNSIYTCLESAFEQVRQTNIDMRGKAEEQLEDAEYKIEQLNDEVSHLNEEVSSLKDEVSLLEDKVYDLETQIEEFESEQE